MVLLTPLPRGVVLSPVLKIETTSNPATETQPATVVSANTVIGTTSIYVVPRVSSQPEPLLTTIFTPPNGCLTNVYNISGHSLVLAPTLLPECYPFSHYETFSPGVCPSGYTAALRNVQTALSKVSLTANSIVTVSSSIGLQTWIPCCPRYAPFLEILTTDKHFDRSAYEVFSLFAYTNSSCEIAINVPVTESGIPPVVLNPSTTFSTALIDTVPEVLISTGANTTLRATTGESTFTTELVTNGRLTISAPVIEVYYQETDTEVASLWSSSFEASSLSIARAANSTQGQNTAAATSSAAVTSSAISNTNSKERSVSGGTIAGIVIGAVVGLVLIIGAIFLWLRWRKRHTKATPEDSAWAKQELDSKPIDPVELEGTKEIKEIYAPDAPPVELPGHALESSEMRISPATPYNPQDNTENI
jgi:hypothetical protein